MNEEIREHDDQRHTVTRLLQQWRGGDSDALDRLLPIVHSNLHGIAQRLMRGERSGHTLEASGLVNEAFLRLIDSRVDWQDRAHFLAIAARTMRRVLVDHAKSRGRHKRGGAQIQVTLNEESIAMEAASDSLLDLEDALVRLAKRDERKAEIAELSLFGGLSREEIAQVLSISASSVARELRFAKAWLQRELSH